jgi:hypothetical protein
VLRRLIAVAVVMTLCCPAVASSAVRVVPPGNSAVFDEGPSLVPTAVGGEFATELNGVLLARASRADPRMLAALIARGPLGRQAASFVAETAVAPGPPGALARSAASAGATLLATLGGSRVGPGLPIALALVAAGGLGAAARRRTRRDGALP